MTEIPRFYYESVKELKNRGMEFLTLALDDEIPSIVGVVLTTEEEREQIDFSEVVSADDINAAVDECLRIENGLAAPYESLILGIDPGLKPGFAVLGDGKVVHAELLGTPEDILEASRKVLDTYSSRRVTFRVGRGGGVYKERVLKILQENFDFPIEVVDESHTTPLTGSGTAVKDVIAAVNIALKQGRILKQKIDVSPTNGEIKNIQRDSREVSGNITISKLLAERVAKGELSIEEAIEAQQGK
jgi:hypothetical protein